MKRSKLEEILRSGGFLGTDTRPLEEIIETDAADLAQLGFTTGQITERMKALSDLARPGLGIPVKEGDAIEVSGDDTRGTIPCPWPHPVHCNKTVTTLRRNDTGKTVRWSELSIHLIEAHGFFQGRGSTFRLEPRDLVGNLF